MIHLQSWGKLNKGKIEMRFNHTKCWRMDRAIDILLLLLVGREVLHCHVKPKQFCSKAGIPICSVYIRQVTRRESWERPCHFGRACRRDPTKGSKALLQTSSKQPGVDRKKKSLSEAPSYHSWDYPQRNNRKRAKRDPSKQQNTECSANIMLDGWGKRSSKLTMTSCPQIPKNCCFDNSSIW